ncbi:hypothetical protein T440DRAFT_214579 [Plenodomus tracheiphilus IPT5]|uniref:Uncharacterized protein n=1 Tax=Plenodomus tracheiphilus IPT5 TaxID=1408161 RepID=A0A6A7AYF3_9PLEO|nr:hypothetical protein T440DRAFT_214579 [Plenodomus tracheiphilus IPT5]
MLEEPEDCVQEKTPLNLYHAGLYIPTQDAGLNSISREPEECLRNSDQTVSTSRTVSSWQTSNTLHNIAAPYVPHTPPNLLYDGDDYISHTMHPQLLIAIPIPRSRPVPRTCTRPHLPPIHTDCDPRALELDQTYTSFRHDHNIRFKLRFSLKQVVQDWRVLCDEDAWPMRIVEHIGGLGRWVKTRFSKRGIKSMGNKG